MSSAKTRAGQSVKATKRHEGYQYSGAQVQNSKKSRVYIFGDADIQDDDVVEYELSEVRSRKSTRPFQQADDEPTYLEREITEGDSLRSISLQYGCSVAEIKRVNNMIQDQEFYAFKKIKVPIQKYSFLTETMNKASEATQEKGGASSCNGMTIVDETIDTDQESLYHDTDTESMCNLSDPETQRLLIKKSLSIKDNTNSQTREAKRFLRNMDKDLSKICKTARPNHSSLNEVVSMLTNRSIQPIPSKKVNQFNGADCGIRWWSIALCTLLTVILIPLIILLYYFKTGKLASDGAHG